MGHHHALAAASGSSARSAEAAPSSTASSFGREHSRAERSVSSRCRVDSPRRRAVACSPVLVPPKNLDTKAVTNSASQIAVVVWWGRNARETTQ